MHHTLVLFDIDGTLLYTVSKTLRARFEYAIKHVHGKDIRIDWEHIEGMIDNSLFAHAFSLTDLPQELFEPSLPELHEKAYEHFVINVPPEYKETILPGAKNLLEHLQTTVHLGVFTGNYEKIGWKKLELVGLRDYFEFGVFGHEATSRNELAKLVPKKAKTYFKTEFSPEEIIFVGDTPRDIECARTIKAKIICVATGKYSKEDLQTHTPDLVSDSLLDPRILKFILGNNTKVA